MCTNIVLLIKSKYFINKYLILQRIIKKIQMKEYKRRLKSGKMKKSVIAEAVPKSSPARRGDWGQIAV